MGNKIPEGRSDMTVTCKSCDTTLVLICHKERNENGEVIFRSEPAFCACPKKHYCELENNKIVTRSNKFTYQISDDKNGTYKSRICWDHK